MKIVVNTSNLSVGGGLQVAISFINELRYLSSDHIYHVFMSPAVCAQLDVDSFPENFEFHFIEESPSSLKFRSKIVGCLDALEARIDPEVVFSLFGPTFWRPKNTHVMGFALPWLIYRKSSALGELKVMSRLKKRLEIAYKEHHVKSNSDYYIVETEETKVRLSCVTEIPLEEIFVVGNTCSAIYYQSNMPALRLPVPAKNEFRLITIAHNYPHKNLKIIRRVIPYLQNRDISYKFYLTIDHKSYEKNFSDLEDVVVNLGPIETAYCPSVYSQCDVVFMPTLLECFSASYPEAMKMEKPILTSNLPFAVDICADAAVYFDPLDPQEIAEKVIGLSLDRSLQGLLVENGKRQLNSFETAQSRAKKYINICEKIVKR